jgi:hypothetical protein
LRKLRLAEGKPGLVTTRLDFSKTAPGTQCPSWDLLSQVSKIFLHTSYVEMTVMMFI